MPDDPRTQQPNLDPDADETAEWLESIDAVVARKGSERARDLLRRVASHLALQGVALPDIRTAPYVNTIPRDDEPAYPGDEAIERRITAYARWNAAAMVTRANRGDLGLGGHISTYASSAVLYEVGFQHFFRGHEDGPGDQVFIQGHASPGIYARAFLEGRLTEEQLDLFRQETKRTSDGRPGLSSYPHPRLMPSFWEFPTVSMGLGPIGAIYQARFNRYLHGRGLADTSRSRVWCFLGDGEMDEPESTGALGVAAREHLDNLVFVVNCNLQRLDGPVRGNGKIVSEMEALFRGAGWNVVKVLWGREWDDLLEDPRARGLIEHLGRVPDGQMQTISVEGADYVRAHLFPDDAARALVSGLSDEQVCALARARGGHDPRKVYAAYEAATRANGRPTVVLAHTIKGWLLGPAFESRNATHQMKKIPKESLKDLRDRLELPLSDEEVSGDYPVYVKPQKGSVEEQYLLERRRALGGFLPSRKARGRKIALPGDDAYADAKKGSGSRPVATTMAFVALLRNLLRHDELGPRIVPIIPDEARTFGMDAFFPSLKIYSPHGQRYEAVDRDALLSYVEATDGQILHEGITEMGSMASFCASGTSYSTFSEPTIPFYVFYSMFGFQRTADMIWQAGDQRARGFLIGATAGRTTLNGEGLQHEDGHSPLLAMTNPACRVYDPSFAFEVGLFVKDGLRRMLSEPAEDVVYYLTVYNEPVAQPPMPDDVSDEDVLSGLYRYRKASAKGLPAQILSSGSAMPLALRAADLLAADWGVAADVWSAPGWVELRRDGIAADEQHVLHPDRAARTPRVTEALAPTEGPVVAVSDYMTALPDLIRPWVPRRFTVLGTDGFGRSDTRPALRRLFRIDAESIAVGVLAALAADGAVKRSVVAKAIAKYGIDPEASTHLP